MQLHCTFLYNIFFSLRTVLYISSHSAVEHPGENELKPPSLRLSPLYRETGPRRLPATAHTTVLVTPGTRHSQWLGRYTDKITHSPATSPFPTFIKTRASYLMWTVHTAQNVCRDVCHQPKMVLRVATTIESEHRNKFWRSFQAAKGDLSPRFTQATWQNAAYVYTKIVFNLITWNAKFSEWVGSELCSSHCFQSSLEVWHSISGWTA